MLDLIHKPVASFGDRCEKICRLGEKFDDSVSEWTRDKLHLPDLVDYIEIRPLCNWIKKGQDESLEFFDMDRIFAERGRLRSQGGKVSLLTVERDDSKADSLSTSPCFLSIKAGARDSF